MDYDIIAKNLLLERTCDNCIKIDATHDGDCCCCREQDSIVAWIPTSEDETCDQWEGRDGERLSHSS